MNKKYLRIFAVLAVAAIAAWNVNYNSQKNDFSDVMLATVEALAGETCLAGGRGASACSIEAALDILGSGGTVKCSVTCSSGYYACCTITGCHCTEN